MNTGFTAPSFTGTGTFTKTGRGTLNLSGTVLNNFTGPLNINQGSVTFLVDSTGTQSNAITVPTGSTLGLNPAQTTATPFVFTNLASRGTLSLNGNGLVDGTTLANNGFGQGAFQLFSSGATASTTFTTEYPGAINLATTSTIYPQYVGTGGTGMIGLISGVISGTGNAGLNIEGGSPLNLTNANTYTGTTNIRLGTIRLLGNGTLASSNYIIGGYNFTTNGSLILDNTTTNLANRIPTNSTLRSVSGLVTLLGNASAASSQTTGALTLSTGQTTLSITPGTGQNATLTVDNIVRGSDRPVLFVRGTTLGSGAGASVVVTSYSTLPADFVGSGSPTDLANTRAPILR
jgi:autotransporter-associated beta strand protein